MSDTRTSTVFRSIWLHHEVRESQLGYPNLQNKADWAMVQLGMFGRTPSFKGTRYHDYRWRRTPIHGNQYYLWWIPGRARGVEQLAKQVGDGAIFVRAIRHHDETSLPLDPGALADYELIKVSDINPLFSDQREIEAN